MSLPYDWNEWRKQWSEWGRANRAHLAPVARSPFPNQKNMMADEILGCWTVKGKVVELSEVRIMGKRVIGLTVFGDDAAATVAYSFAELETLLGLREPGEAEENKP